MQTILGSTRKADIVFYRGGRISISARVSKLLALAHGDVIDMSCGGGEVYLFVKHRTPVIGRHEGMVFRSNKSGKHCVASSIRLCRWMFSQFGDDSMEKLESCIGEPVQLKPYGTVLPIITRLLHHD